MADVNTNIPPGQANPAAKDPARPACVDDPRRRAAGYATCGAEADEWLDRHLKPPVEGLDDASGPDIGSLTDLGTDFGVGGGRDAGSDVGTDMNLISG